MEFQLMDTDAAEDLPPLAKALFGGNNLDETHAAMQSEMEVLSEHVRLAVLKCQPKQLIGFLWGQLLMGQLRRPEAGGESDNRASLDDLMFALEYVHAVLSSHAISDHGKSVAMEDMSAVLQFSNELRHHALMYCMVAARRMPDGLFGPETGMVAMQAMTSWITIRGHRYQALEAEFFEFVLEPHEDALQAAYGVGAKEVATGIQAAVDATRYGHMQAADALEREVNRAYELAEKENIELREAIERIHGQDLMHKQVAQDAISGLFFGGICNVSKTSGLPDRLLVDISYSPGDEGEFFAPGPLRGTPLRRMPGRVKPLITLDDGHYTCDANFLRDSTYRALQWGLLRRLPDYKQEWIKRQTMLTEAAFLQIFGKQLVGAEVLTNVYYPDPDTGKWVENDVLILQNDVLLQLEVKAGIMPMHSPEVFFEKHVRTIQELIIKAYRQCERFLRYAILADEVSLYQLVDGKYQEFKRLRLSDYRVVLPIGLTVEAFTPFSSMSKRLSEMQPILGKYPFVSMSIDDLFVISRFLFTTGQLMHYLTVRQRVAGVKEAFLFDEIDHLGAYVHRNCVDMFYSEKLTDGVNLMIDDGTCAIVDSYFANPDWQTKKPPAQAFPMVLQDLLEALDRSRGSRFLEADAAIRDMSAMGREDLAHYITQLLPSLQQHSYRWFMLLAEEPLLVWLQQSSYVDFAQLYRDKAEAVALVARAPQCKVLIFYVNLTGRFEGGWAKYIQAPSKADTHYAERLEDAKKMEQRSNALTPKGAEWLQQQGRLP